MKNRATWNKRSLVSSIIVRLLGAHEKVGTGSVIAVVGLLTLYVGAYLLLVTPDPPSGPCPVTVSSGGIVSPVNRTEPNDVVYHGLFGQLHLSPRIFHPILSIDRKLRPGRWFSVSKAWRIPEPNPALQATAAPPRS